MRPDMRGVLNDVQLCERKKKMLRRSAAQRSVHATQLVPPLLQEQAAVFESAVGLVASTLVFGFAVAELLTTLECLGRSGNALNTPNMS